MYVNDDNDDNTTSFASCVIEYIPKETKKFIDNRNITTNIYKIQAYDSIMRGYFCIGFIDFVLKGKSLLDYTNLFSPDVYEKNYDDYILLFVKSMKNLKTLKNHTF